MTTEAAKLAIVFADISGSTTLYDTLGDVVARNLVSQCISLMTKQMEKYQGVLVKTIGDEIMCTFPSASQGLEAVIGMQEEVTDELRQQTQDPKIPVSLSIRVGLHYGPVIQEEGDVYGDAVNVAARMAARAKSGQIITTKDTVEVLPPALREITRHVDTMPVKGKAKELDVFEVIWEPEEDVTRMATQFMPNLAKQKIKLKLRYHDQEVELNQDSPTLFMGRSREAGLSVKSSRASRKHLRIECLRGKFVLTDQSINGTTVLTSDGRVNLRSGEDLFLSGKGKISLGGNIKDDTEIVTFICYD